jgi:hypothetical protein
VSPFRELQTNLNPEEMATLQSAYDDACRELDIEPGARDGDRNDTARFALVAALLSSARRGERNGQMLRINALLAVRAARVGGKGSD